MTIFLLLALSLGANGSAAPPAPPAGGAVAATPTELLKQAKANFDYGNYPQAAAICARLLAGRELERSQEQVEAYRLLGLSRYFLHDPEGAHEAFLNLLSLDPDFQLDPFYVPPPAVALFEKVRTDNQTLLQPIRDRRRAAQEQLRLEEVARQRLLAQAGLPPPTVRIVHEQLERRNPAIALLPLGIGQFQNGERTLGFVLAGAEAATLATSFVSYSWFQGHRIQDGTFDPSLQSTAIAVRALQIGTGAAFFGLWAFGVGEALWHFNGTVIVKTEEDDGASPPSPTDRQSPSPPSAPPSAPARAPAAPVHVSIAPLPDGVAGSISLNF